jgi:hypothetical protein
MSSSLLKAQLQRHKVRHEREAKLQQQSIQTTNQTAQASLKRKSDTQNRAQSNKLNKRKKSASKKPIKIKPKKPVQKADPNLHAFPSLPVIKPISKSSTETDHTQANLQFLLRSSKQRAQLLSHATTANQSLIAKKFKPSRKSADQQHSDDEPHDDFEESDGE